MNPILAQDESNPILCAEPKNISSFVALYDKYSPALLGVIHTIITDDQVAIEVLQLCYTHIWERMNEYPANKMRIFTWMYQLTRSVACAYKNEHLNTVAIPNSNIIKKAVAFSAIAKNYSHK